MNKHKHLAVRVRKPDIIRSTPFFIQPAFWDSWSFKTLLIILISGVAYLIYRLRVRFLLRQKKDLEKEVKARTHEQELLIENLEHTIRQLEESKEELYQNNLFKQRLAIIIAHDLRSPLRFLFEGMRRLYHQAADRSDPVIEEGSIELLKATGNIYGFVDDFSCWLSTMGKGFEVNCAAVEIRSLLFELETFFNEQLQAKQNQILFPDDHALIVHTDRQLLKIILRNIIDNANKYTAKGLIEIKLRTNGTRCAITIKDNGQGMSDDRLENIKKRLLDKNADQGRKPSGYGYGFIGDFSRLLKMDVGVESIPGQGTAVSLSNLQINNP